MFRTGWVNPERSRRGNSGGALKRFVFIPSANFTRSTSLSSKPCTEAARLVMATRRRTAESILFVVISRELRIARLCSVSSEGDDERGGELITVVVTCSFGDTGEMGGRKTRGCGAAMCKAAASAEGATGAAFLRIGSLRRPDIVVTTSAGAGTHSVAGGLVLLLLRACKNAGRMDRRGLAWVMIEGEWIPCPCAFRRAVICSKEGSADVWVCPGSVGCLGRWKFTSSTQFSRGDSSPTLPNTDSGETRPGEGRE